MNIQEKSFGKMARGFIRSIVRRSQGGAREERALVERAGMLDPDWYKRQYPDLAVSGMDPLEHYLNFGAAEGRNPCASFDTEYYLSRNPDVAASGMNPLLHFCEHGWLESRLPMEGFDLKAYAKARNKQALSPSGATAFVPGMKQAARLEPLDEGVHARIKAAGLFDEGYYLSQFDSADDVIGDALAHYLQAGAGQKKAPAPWFDAAFYVRQYRDVARSKIFPFLHFCEYGLGELRNPSAGFDAVWFFINHPDMVSRGVQVIGDHLRNGWGGDQRVRRVGPYSHNERVRALNVVVEYLATAPVDAQALRVLGALCNQLKAPAQAALVYERLVALLPQDVGMRRKLAESQLANRDWASAVTTLSILDEMAPDNVGNLRKLAGALGRIGESKRAIEAYDRVAKASKKHDDYYALGLACEDSGDTGQAGAAYVCALKTSKLDARAKKYGIGALHQQHGEYSRALTSYQELVKQLPWDAGLRHRIGYAHDRLYCWRQAEDAYRLAIVGMADENSQVASWHYRLGFVRERMRNWNGAANAYSAALSLSTKDKPEWRYRLGCVLDRLGDSESAYQAYAGSSLVAETVLEMDADVSASTVDGDGSAETPRSKYFHELAIGTLPEIERIIDQDRSQPEGYVLLGDCKMRLGNWLAAADAYKAGLARSSDPAADWYAKAIAALAKVGKYHEACVTYQSANGFRGAYGLTEAAMQRNAAETPDAAYVEYVRTLELDDSVIMYESFSGLSMSCNPLAIFKYLIADPAYSGFTHVWVVNERERVPEEYRRRTDVVIVKRESDAYKRYLAMAKYLINNSGFAPYFIRREGQKYLATWHGTPLKTLGKEQKYKFYDHKRTQRNFLQATHIISPNKHTTDVQLDSYDVRPVFTGKFSETGYPRIDLTLNATPEFQQELRRRMGLSADKPVVLYAPTWRGTPDEVRFDFSRVENDLKELGKLGCQVIFRGHSWLERAINTTAVDCHVVPADIDTNELLSIVDILITDYSSVFFDFIVTGKPILYYIYDLEEYEKERGLYFDMMEMPGHKCRTIDELCGALEGILHKGQTDEDSYRVAREKFSNHDDGNATKRVVDFLFKDDSALAIDYKRAAKRSVVLHGGMYEEGPETERLIAVAKALDDNGWNVIVMFNPVVVEAMPGSIARFRRLPADIIGIPRHGSILMTPEERWLRLRHEGKHELIGKESIEIVRNMYDREFSRMLPHFIPDAIVVIDGKDSFWPKLLLDNTHACKKAVLTNRESNRWLDESVVVLPMRESCEQDVSAILQVVG
ncbi:MAG: CDP-glycerol glycerophosphotransferase family protein [Pseudoxanthomonas sp.]